MREDFEKALQGKHIPLLTLDHKWYQLFDDKTKESIKKQTDELNTLLQQQARLEQEMKSLKKIKRQLLNEIMELSQEESDSNQKKIEQKKKLIEDCNQRQDACQDKLLDLPYKVEKVNLQLMMFTMEYCYSHLNNHQLEIHEIDEWVTKIRIELKKKLIQKQQAQKQYHDMYAYMHDIFGAEILNLFDLEQPDQSEQN